MRSLSRSWIPALALLALSLSLAGCPKSGSKPPPGVRAVGNSVCPVSGKPVGGKASAPTFHSDFRGHRIGFMCPVCKSTFDRADGTKKLALLNKALGSVGKKPLPPPKK